MSTPEPLVALSEKIDTLIKIQAAIAIKGMVSQREKIVFLYGAGLGPSFIASLLGTSPNAVSATMVRHKKAAAGKEGANDE